MHFCFAKVRTSSVTFGDTFPKGEGMTTPQILIYRVALVLTVVVEAGERQEPFVALGHTVAQTD